jgi:hypothetical protein
MNQIPGRSKVNRRHRSTSYCAQPFRQSAAAQNEAGPAIQLTSGDYNDGKPQLSPGGNTLQRALRLHGVHCFLGAPQSQS